MEITRRTVLAGVAVAVAGGTAGCIGGGSDDSGPENVDFDQIGSVVDPDEINIPTVMFSFSHREADGVVSVSHSGGRSVSVDNLYIRGDGIADEYDGVPFTNLPDSEFSSGDQFGSGDNVLVEVVDDEFRVQVMWVDLETNRAAVVDQIVVGLEESE